ncbi:MAG: NADP-dependent oxidoreductase [Bdellovibrio sp.]|nr:NADP-dependent oxidoreductase [Bdellovibrio sp.]
MQAAYIDKYSDTEKMKIGEFPMPTVGDRDILVRIKAASVNPIDFKVKEGKLKFLRKYSFPMILGHDVSGEVVEIGKHVTKFKKGDLIFSRPRGGRIGTFAEYIAIDQDDAALKPGDLSFEEAASLPLVGLTTWQTFETAKLQAGQKVFIPAGSGGIGTFAIQLAKLRGAEVWTSTSEKNESLVKSLGADHVINYKNQDPWKVLSDLDLVFDTLGGQDLYNSFTAVKPNGWVISIAGDPDHNTAKDMGLGVVKSLILRMVGFKVNKFASAKKVHYRFLFMKANGPQLEQIKELVEQKKLHPVVDKVFPLSAIQEALDYSKSGRARGKIVISVP